MDRGSANVFSLAVAVVPEGAGRSVAVELPHPLKAATAVKRSPLAMTHRFITSSFLSVGCTS
jgi:hypothetical protein